MFRIPGNIDAKERQPAKNKAANNYSNSFGCFCLHFEFSNLGKHQFNIQLIILINQSMSVSKPEI